MIGPLLQIEVPTGLSVMHLDKCAVAPEVSPGAVKLVFFQLGQPEPGSLRVNPLLQCIFLPHPEADPTTIELTPAPLYWIFFRSARRSLNFVPVPILMSFFLRGIPPLPYLKGLYRTTLRSSTARTILLNFILERPSPLFGPPSSFSSGTCTR